MNQDVDGHAVGIGQLAFNWYTPLHHRLRFGGYEELEASLGIERSNGREGDLCAERLGSRECRPEQHVQERALMVGQWANGLHGHGFHGTSTSELRWTAAVGPTFDHRTQGALGGHEISNDVGVSIHDVSLWSGSGPHTMNGSCRPEVRPSDRWPEVASRIVIRRPVTEEIGIELGLLHPTVRGAPRHKARR